MARTTCGAKNRKGEPCRGIAMANGRCRMHGGTNPGAPASNTHALKHGFYSSALLPGERKLYERAEIGSLDDEIRLAKVKLFRYIQLEGNRDLQSIVDGELEVIQRREDMLRDVIVHEDMTDQELEKFRQDKKRVRLDRLEIRAAAPNYGDLILKQLDVIRKLELAALQLRNQEGGDEDDDTTPEGQPDEAAPQSPIR